LGSLYHAISNALHCTAELKGGDREEKSLGLELVSLNLFTPNTLIDSNGGP